MDEIKALKAEDFLDNSTEQLIITLTYVVNRLTDIQESITEKKTRKSVLRDLKRLAYQAKKTLEDVDWMRKNATKYVVSLTQEEAKETLDRHDTELFALEIEIAKLKGEDTKKMEEELEEMKAMSFRNQK